MEWVDADVATGAESVKIVNWEDGESSAANRAIVEPASRMIAPRPDGRKSTAACAILSFSVTADESRVSNG